MSKEDNNRHIRTPNDLTGHTFGKLMVLVGVSVSFKAFPLKTASSLALSPRTPVAEVG